MKIKNVILCLIVFVLCVLNVGADFEEYQKLENKKTPLIKREDLPKEFSGKAYDMIVEFIEKTYELNYEWALFFDYRTGEILKCVKGKSNNVNVDFDDGEFEGKQVASIHNHPINDFSPHSGKNFNILCRSFEDYEIVVGRDGLWILKAKGVHKNIIEDIRKASLFSYIFTLYHCGDLENSGNDEECEDSLYGGMLSSYVNDKKLNGIQLTKVEYVTMTIDLKSDVVEFEHFERLSNPEDFKIFRDFVDNPDFKVNKQRISEFFSRMNIEADVDVLADEMQRYRKALNF